MSKTTEKTTVTVKMGIVDPGTKNDDSEFEFELEPRWDARRTVKFALHETDAKQLFDSLKVFLGK